MNIDKQWVAFSTIVSKEIRRFTRIWVQTLLPPAITMALYFVIFGQLIGERIGLHPLAVIFALLAFGHLFGFFGVLLALPASAILAAALRALRHRYLASALYQA